MMSQSHEEDFDMATEDETVKYTTYGAHLKIILIFFGKLLVPVRQQH